MDEGLSSQDPSGTYWLEALREYGAGDRSEIRSPAKSVRVPQAKQSGQKAATPSHDEALTEFAIDTTSPSLKVHHASPISPLRERDSEALNEFFESDRIQDITLDIHRYLARMYPEPCWEDEPYEFLKGYI